MPQLDSLVLNLLSKKVGYDVTKPEGSSILQKDIEKETGQHLGLNTVKRMTGVISYDWMPRESTLIIIANYLGFRSWIQLKDYISGNISDFSKNPDFIDLSTLQKNITVRIEWMPDRVIEIIHRGEGKYKILKAENSKLKVSDEIILSIVGKGIPLLLKSVVRNGVNLGSYTAASESGISLVEIL